ncbi:MAG: hypothetical protein E7290_15345 [Lachnospiraceae bacterium]|nr:hypothetical protein [Lachnospiraceae bacterium]
MKPVKGYAEAQTYTETERLPVGGYILKILDVKIEDNSSKGYNDKLILSFDIVEGEFKDFFKNNYKQQSGEDKKWKGTFRIVVPSDNDPKEDEWKMRRFKTIMSDFEESNAGFHFDWDEQKLKGKLIGGIFNNKEYDFNGRHGFYTQCKVLTAVEKIRTGKFAIPEDDLLKNGTNNTSQTRPDADGFMNIPDGIDEELPF